MLRCIVLMTRKTRNAARFRRLQVADTLSRRASASRAIAYLANRNDRYTSPLFVFLLHWDCQVALPADCNYRSLAFPTAIRRARADTREREEIITKLSRAIQGSRIVWVYACVRKYCRICASLSFSFSFSFSLSLSLSVYYISTLGCGACTLAPR